MVRELRLVHRLLRAAATVVAHGLVAALVCLACEVFVPSLRVWVFAAAAAWLALAGTTAALRARLPAHQIDRELGLRDRLTTWLGLRERERQADGFPLWLQRDLEAALEGVPAPRRRAPILPRLGPIRYLVPVLVFLLLLRWLAPPAWPGLGGGGGGASGSGLGGEVAQGGGAAAQADRSPRPEPRPPQTESRPEPREQDPPPPLLQLPVRDEFVVPRFVGDGETRRALAQRALLEQAEPRAPQPAERRTRPEPGPEPSAVDPAREYQKAYERALASRHVPERERGFVRRYFAALVELGR